MKPNKININSLCNATLSNIEVKPRLSKKKKNRREKEEAEKEREKKKKANLARFFSVSIHHHNICNNAMPHRKGEQ